MTQYVLLRLYHIPAYFCQLANDDFQILAHGVTEMGFLGVYGLSATEN